MNLFDSVNHSLTTMATGGYSTKQASIAFYDSPFIQYVIILFMFIAGTNFALSYFAIHGNPKKLFKNSEFKYYFRIVIGASLIIAIGLIWKNGLGVEQAIRDSLFQVVSILTTTGCCYYRLLTVAAGIALDHSFPADVYWRVCRFNRRWY